MKNQRLDKCKNSNQTFFIVALFVFVAWFSPGHAISQTVLTEDFTNGLTNWTPFGSPASKIVSIHGESTAFDNMGDSWCGSGAISKQQVEIVPGTTFSFRVYLDVWDYNGCWAIASVWLSNGVKLTTGDCAGDGYEAYGLLSFNMVGHQCWASPEEQHGHSYISVGGFAVKADEYVNGWHILKAEVVDNYYAKLYIDEQYMGISTAPIDSKFLNNPYVLLGYRSSGVGGKAYIDNVVIEKKTVWTPQAYNQLFDDSSTLELLRNYRDQVLSKFSKGALYTNLLYDSSDEALQVLMNNKELTNAARLLIDTNKEAIKAVLDGQEGIIQNTEGIASFLDSFAKKSPEDLKLLAIAVKKELLRSQRDGEKFFGFRLN